MAARSVANPKTPLTNKRTKPPREAAVKKPTESPSLFEFEMPYSLACGFPASEQCAITCRPEDTERLLLGLWRALSSVPASGPRLQDLPALARGLARDAAALHGVTQAVDDRKRRPAMNSHAAFLAGRDLAVELLREKTTAEAVQCGTIEARYRDGAEQNNYVYRYFLRLLDEPELAPGFCAVLSDSLVDSGGPDPEVYERLSIGEMLGPRHDAGFIRLLDNLNGAPAE